MAQKKKGVKKKGAEVKRDKPNNQDKTLNMLIENSITLQKALTELAFNIKGLSKDVSQLLGLFKEANKAFTEGKRPATEEGRLGRKLDILIEQSRAIARGLVLLESYLKEKISQKKEEEPKPKQLPQFRF